MSTPNNKFYSLLESTIPAPQRLEEINKKPLSETNYLICFTPRLSSTLLTEVLSSTGMMGYPEEWFNPRDVVPYVLKQRIPCNIVTDYMNCLRRECSTSNRIFGCETTTFDLSLVLEKTNLSSLFGDNLFFISLIREDFVSQVISLYKSVKSLVGWTERSEVQRYQFVGVRWRSLQPTQAVTTTLCMMRKPGWPCAEDLSTISDSCLRKFRCHCG